MLLFKYEYDDIFIPYIIWDKDIFSFYANELKKSEISVRVLLLIAINLGTYFYN